MSLSRDSSCGFDSTRGRPRLLSVDRSILVFRDESECTTTAQPPQCVTSSFDCGTRECRVRLRALNTNALDVQNTEQRLSEKTTDRIAFRVLTTAPDDYVVRPVHGLLTPGETQQIRFRLRPDRDVDLRKHRFRICAKLVSRDEQRDWKTLWMKQKSDEPQQHRESVQILVLKVA